jgi:hypothetical protein
MFHSQDNLGYCHPEERGIFARSSTKIDDLVCGVTLRRSLVPRDDKNAHNNFGQNFFLQSFFKHQIHNTNNL